MPTLPEWEKRLKPLFTPRLRIIGELPLNRADVEDIGAQVKDLIHRKRIAEASRVIFAQYPFTFLALLAAFAAHNIKGNYWGALADFIGTDRQAFFNYDWHRNFIKGVKRLGLKFFDFEDAGNPYVTTIRFHGGIPAYSLPDFFGKIVLPSIQRSDLREVDSAAVLKAMLPHVYFVDSPVINFLQYSGDLGEEFFDACRKLAKHYKTNQGDLLSAEELELPGYVIEAFENFMERKAEPGFHLHKPILLFFINYDRAHLFLKLPEQEVSLRYAGGKIEWHVCWVEGAELKIPCRLHRRRQVTLLEEDYVPIDAIPQRVQVELVFLPEDEPDHPEIIRRWTLPFYSPDTDAPLFAFRTTDGQLTRSSQGLPAEVLMLVYPQNAELTFDGIGHLEGEHWALAGAWKMWQAKTWNLEGAWSICVSVPGQEDHTIPILGHLPEPELVGGHLSPFNEQRADGKTLYIGEPPEIKIPHVVRNGRFYEMEKWKIELDMVNEADPEVDKVKSFGEIKDYFRYEDDTAFLNLIHFLKINPVGTYHVVISGPEILETEFRFSIFPKLCVLSLPKTVTPVNGESPRLSIGLRLPEGAGCEAQAGSGDIQVTPGNGAWNVEIGGDVFQADLNLLWTRDDGVLVRVPISIPIPRVRWALAMDQNPGTLDLGTRLIQKSLDTFLQGEYASLHIEMHGLGEMLERVHLELVDACDEERTLQSEQFQKTALSPDWLRAPLAAFRGTLQHGCQMGRFDMVIQQPGQDPIRVPLASFSRGLEITDVHLIRISDRCWRLTWKEEHPLRNRRVMIAPMWQPWLAPREYKISDTTRGNFIIEQKLEPTGYGVYFYTYPDWEPAHDSPPDGIQPFIVGETDLPKRLRQLLEDPGKNSTFQGIIEIASLFITMNDPANRDDWLTKGSMPFHGLNDLEVIVNFLKWLDRSEIPSPIKSFYWNKAFNPQRVERILQYYNRNHPNLNAYIQLIPRVKNLHQESAKLLLKKTDDPAVIHTCLMLLLRKESADLIPTILSMIDNARLSNRDAKDILNEKLSWAMDRLAEVDDSNTSSRLMAALLPDVEILLTPDEPLLITYILRSIQFIQDKSVLKRYLEILIRSSELDGLLLTMQLFQMGKLDRGDIESLLSSNPKFSILTLESNAPACQQHHDWIEWLVDRFPEHGNVIKDGVMLNTPAGIGIIDYIEKLDGTRVLKSRLSDPNIRINLVVGEGRTRARFWLDMSSGILQFPDHQNITKCPHCDFYSPFQRVTTEHQEEHHRNQLLGYNMVKPTIQIRLDQINIHSRLA